jgi:UDP-3-O-[3-hydroxymyristoyl] glucosamine N-acyltransferase
MKLSKLCEAIGLSYRGEDCEIAAIAPPDEAGANDLSFIEQDRYLPSLKKSRAAAVLVRSHHADQVPAGVRALVVDNPYLMMARASALFTPPACTQAPQIGPDCTIDHRATIANGSTLGAGCRVMAGAVIGEGVSIGQDVVIYPNVVIYDGAEIGDRVRIHAGSVIGSDGFGYAHTPEGEHIKIHHFGRVVIESDVEIGANAAIDRAVFGQTRIKKGTKVDNLVHIAHNVEIGEHSLLAAQVGFAGSAKTGRNFTIGGQSGVSGHLKVGDFTTVAARSGVTKSVEGGKTYAGFPLMEHRLWLRLQARIAKLVK